MTEKERWLRGRIKAAPRLDPNEQMFIDRLNNEELSEAELSSCIDCLEILLSLDALMPLVNIMKDQENSMLLRKHAAKAISVIGSDYVESELMAILYSPSSDLRLLAEIALGIKSPNAE